MFGYENGLFFPIHVSKFEDSMYLLLLNDDDKSNYVYIKDLYFTKQKIKTNSVLVVKVR